MEIENQVTSLDLSKKLKELGVKKEGFFLWENKMGKWHLIWRDYHKFDYIDTADLREYVSAFTVAELGEMLPREIKTDDKIVHHLRFQKTYHPTGTGKRKDYFWTVSYEYGEDDDIDNWWIVEDYWEADVRAKMLIYLIKNKLLTPN